MGFLAVLGGNELAVPAIRRFRELGHRVLSIDGNAQAPARECADAFLHVNFSDIHALREGLKDFRLTGIMPINDFGVRPASILARERGLPGNSERTAMCGTSKALMRKAWSAAGLPQPRYAIFSVEEALAGNESDWQEFPAVIKPSYSGGGSRGVGLVNSWTEIRGWLADNRASFIDPEFLIEEYIQGTEHTAELLVWTGGARLLSISDKQNYSESVSVVQNLYFPGPIGNDYRAEIEPLLHRASEALGMTAGTGHFEVLIRDGKVYLLEVGVRPGGGINLHPICLLSTGYDYAGLYACVLTGGEPTFDQSTPVHLAWHYFESAAGRVLSIEGVENVRSEPDLVDVKIYQQEGADAMDKRNDLARPGYVLVKGPTHEKARARAIELSGRIRFQCAPSSTGTPN